MRISDLSYDVCTSDREQPGALALRGADLRAAELFPFFDVPDHRVFHVAAPGLQQFPETELHVPVPQDADDFPRKIGSASCRERVEQSVLIPVVAGSFKHKQQAKCTN